MLSPNRRRPTRGEHRRAEIVAAAADLGSAEGLERLSIGGLARAIGMSKSGLFAHFGSKEELQLAVIDAAAAEFEAAVEIPPLASEPGLARLRAMLDAWVAYLGAKPFRGGCFFAAASREYQSREGAVRDELARTTGHWIAALEEQARVAVRQRELAADLDTPLFVFRLHAYVQQANWMRELFDDPHAFARASLAIASTLDAASAPEET